MRGWGVGAGPQPGPRPRRETRGRGPPQGGLPRGGRCGRSTCTRGWEGAISLTEFLQDVVDGLGSGTLYVLVAIGVTLVFGGIGLRTVAQADFYMLVAFGLCFVGGA